MVKIPGLFLASALIIGSATAGIAQTNQNAPARATAQTSQTAPNTAARVERTDDRDDMDWGWIGLLGLLGLAGLMGRKRDDRVAHITPGRSG